MLCNRSVLQLFALGLVMVMAANRLKAQQVALQAPSIPPGVHQFLQPDNSNDMRTNQLLGIPTSHCGHVINLLMTNQMRERNGFNGSEEQQLSHLTAGLQPGDLELQCVHLVCEGDSCKGPVFQIGMRNSSSVPIGNFKVTLVGVLYQIHVHSPAITICIPRMEAGEETLIQMQLPQNCMCIPGGAEPAVFDTLVVALDSYDELLECDELNNVQILKRCEIGVLVSDTVDLPQGEAGLAIPVPSVVAPEYPVQQPAPLDSIDLDKLEIGEAQNLLFRMQ